MTRDETIAAIAVMQAWVDDKPIQFESPIDGKWIDLSPSKPVWDWNGANYRIKPEPRFFHFAEFSDGSLSSRPLDDEEVANYLGKPVIRSTRLVKFIEVLS